MCHDRCQYILLTVLAVSMAIRCRTFSYTAPSMWNEIALEIRNSLSLASCKKHLRRLIFLVPVLSPTTQSSAPRTERVHA